MAIDAGCSSISPCSRPGRPQTPARDSEHPRSFSVAIRHDSTTRGACARHFSFTCETKSGRRSIEASRRIARPGGAVLYRPDHVRRVGPVSISDDDINEQPADDGCPARSQATPTAPTRPTATGPTAMVTPTAPTAPTATPTAPTATPTGRTAPTATRTAPTPEHRGHWQVRRVPHPDAPRSPTWSATSAEFSAGIVFRGPTTVGSRPRAFADLDALWDDLLPRGTRQPAFRVVRAGTTAAGDVTRRAGIGNHDLDDLIAPNQVVDRYRDGDTVVLQGLHHTDRRWPGWPTTSPSRSTTRFRSTPTSRRRRPGPRPALRLPRRVRRAARRVQALAHLGAAAAHDEPGQGRTRSPSRGSTSSAIRCSTSRWRQATACTCRGASRTRRRPSTRHPSTSRSGSSRSPGSASSARRSTPRSLPAGSPNRCRPGCSNPARHHRTIGVDPDFVHRWVRPAPCGTGWRARSGGDSRRRGCVPGRSRARPGAAVVHAGSAAVADDDRRPGRARARRPRARHAGRGARLPRGAARRRGTVRRRGDSRRARRRVAQVVLRRLLAEGVLVACRLATGAPTRRPTAPNRSPPRRRCAAWVLIEVRGAWGEDAVHDSALGGARPGRLEGPAQAAPRPRGVHSLRLATTAGVRLYACAPARPGAGRRRCGDATSTRWPTWSPPSTIWPSIVARGAGWEPLDEQLILVCTNGRHDQCCANRGRPVVRALRDSPWASRVWECSHIGGDRFAANVVVCPTASTSVASSPTRHRGAPLDAGRIDLAHFRGRTSFSLAEQAVEHFVRPSSASTGSTRIVDGRVATAPSGPRRRSGAARPHRPPHGVRGRTTHLRRTAGPARPRFRLVSIT